MFIYFQNSRLKDILTGLLIIATLLMSGGYALFFPKKAQAIPVFDAGHIAMQIGKFIWEGLQWAWERSKWVVETVSSKASSLIDAWEQSEHWAAKALMMAAQIALRQVMAQLTNQIIEWIQNGYKGNPQFITNWEEFFKKAADNAGGEFVDKYLGAGYLCEPFDANIEIGLSNIPTFETEAKCTLTDMGKNIKKFYDDFNQGGWSEWFNLSQPHNSLYGAFLISQESKTQAEQRGKEAAKSEGESGGGFLSIKCTEDMAAAGKCAEGTITTPGKLISHTIEKAITLDLDTLSRQLANLAPETGSYFTPYIIAIGDALVNKTIQDGLAYISKSGTSKSSMPIGTILPEANNIPGKSNRELLIAQISLENLNSVQKNLEDLLIKQQRVLMIIEKMEKPETSPIEFFSQFNKLQPVLNKAKNWEEVCEPCNYVSSNLFNPCYNWYRHRDGLIGAINQKHLFEEYGERSIIVNKTNISTVEEIGKSYSFSFENIINEGLSIITDTQITTTVTDTGEITATTTIPVERYYSWIEWYVKIEDINISGRKTGQEATDYIKQIITDFINKLKDKPVQTENIIQKIEAAVYLLEQYMATVNYYLKIYQENAEDPSLTAIETSMAESKNLTIAAIQEINYPDKFDSDTLEDINLDIQEFAEKIANESGYIMQLLGDKDYPQNNNLYGLISALEKIMPNLSSLYNMCETGK